MSYLEIAKGALADLPPKPALGNPHDPVERPGDSRQWCERSEESEQSPPRKTTAQENKARARALPMTAEEERKLSDWIAEDLGLPAGFVALYPPEALPKLLKLWGLGI
jgi:hypothetical protein